MWENSDKPRNNFQYFCRFVPNDEASFIINAPTELPHSADICGQNLKIKKLRIERSGQRYTNIGVYIGVKDFLVRLFMILIIKLPFAFT